MAETEKITEQIPMPAATPEAPVKEAPEVPVEEPPEVSIKEPPEVLVKEAPGVPIKEALEDQIKAPLEDQTKTVNTGAAFQIPKDKLDLSALRKMDIPNVRSRIQTEFESNRGYQMVADHIITVSQQHLSNQQRDKVELRKKFANLFSVLLVLEYIFMVIFILLDAITAIPVDVPDAILQLYITSVFLQTLSTIGVMIAFAFVSKEETRIVGLLNQIIQNYQKFQIDAPPKDPKP